MCVCSDCPVCAQEERLRRGDDLRLQMALEESKKEGPDSGKLKKRKEVQQRPQIMSRLLSQPRVSIAGLSMKTGSQVPFFSLFSF